MFNRLAHQATAFGLATLFTLAILSSIDLLATEPAAHELMAAAAVAAPQS